MLKGQYRDYFALSDVLTHHYRYPADNCAAHYQGLGTPVNPQDIFPEYLTHQSGIGIIRDMLNSTILAQQYKKPFIMFETNTASCGGFPGISDSFTAALWGLDYAMQMAYTNFTAALFHFGGQNVAYNVSCLFLSPSWM